jgi:hypothetical protein
METATINPLRQLISSKPEVEDKVLFVEEEKSLFIDGGTCSLCAYQIENENLRALTPEEAFSFHKLIQEDEESLRCCDPCYKVVIGIIKVSKGLAQSVTYIKDVLKTKRSSPAPHSSPAPSKT